MRTGAEGSQRKGSSSDPGGDVSQGDEEGLVAVEIRTCQGARGPPKWLGSAGRRGWEGQQVRLGLGLGSPEAMLNLHLGKDMGPQLWAGRAAVGREGPGFRALSPRCSAVLGANPEGRGAKNLGGWPKRQPGCAGGRAPLSAMTVIGAGAWCGQWVWEAR